MDWTTVGSVLASNFFVAFVSLTAARWQIGSAKQDLDKRLQSERERDLRERRRQVRSEPLLRFRTELARMATKCKRLVEAAQKLHTRFDMTEEDALKVFEQARQDLNSYLQAGALVETLFTLDDTALAEKAEEINKDYQRAFIVHTTIPRFEILDKKEIEEAWTVCKRNAKRVAELQGLISSR